MVGASLASSMAFGLGIPAVPIHHMEGHLLATMLETEAPAFPFLALLVSGGHTQLVARARARALRDHWGDARRCGRGGVRQSRAALSLPYPGGAALAALAEQGDPERFALPRPLDRRGLDFSFSGLKTATRLAIEAEGGAVGRLDPAAAADLAASFQAAVVDTLVAKCRAALEYTGLERLVIAGGVGANMRLRAALARLGEQLGRPRLLSAAGALHRQRCDDRLRGCLPLSAADPAARRYVARPRWQLDELEPPVGAA